MFGYYKGEPNQYVIAFKNGVAIRQGAGINFWYARFNTTLTEVPIASQEAPFIFREITNDHQEIAIQGILSYRLTKPEEIARRINFTIDSKTKSYKKEDPAHLVQRVVNTVQECTRDIISGLSLEATLASVKTLSDNVYDQVSAAPALSDLGVVIDSLHFTSVAATPETRKALEAEYRESLNKRADQAIYARRFAAAEEERKLREGEMNTEVELENRRKDLVDMQARNNLALAEAEAKADEMKLSPYGDLPPQALVGLALKEFAGNAGNIGNLTITPDLLERIAGWVSRAEH